MHLLGLMGMQGEYTPMARRWVWGPMNLIVSLVLRLRRRGAAAFDQCGHQPSARPGRRRRSMGRSTLGMVVPSPPAALQISRLFNHREPPPLWEKCSTSPPARASMRVAAGSGPRDAQHHTCWMPSPNLILEMRAIALAPFILTCACRSVSSAALFHLWWGRPCGGAIASPRYRLVLAPAVTRTWRPSMAEAVT